MEPDITIEVRFKTAGEGGRGGPVRGPQFSCPMFISDEAFDCRLLIGSRTLELGVKYQLPVKFLNSSLALPNVTPGQEIILWEGKPIATGRVLRVGA